ncbi:MAG: aromatic ring-hydroxylating dioxygenase subunit alpha [Granulosicoccus sp.]|nr:aromatic ring-hydroxylating dioxygenase subunit alpha [Granulosicoccus sp.]
MPAALSDELEGDRPVAPVRLLGEDLVLFRSESGELGLIQRRCPHRGADLCYGRLEGSGLRCVFHGWKFDSTGQCLEQPAEPEGSKMHTQIQARSYPVVEHNGMVFAFMGAGTPPPLPGVDCFRAPDSHVFAFKGLWRCNWLQALEVGIDPAHASFLHRFLEDEDPAESYGKQFRDTAADTEIPMTRLLREFPRPQLEVEETEFGLRLIALRQIDGDRTHVRVTNQLFPCAIVIPMSNDMTITQWHVPIDDTHCYWFAMFTSFTDPVDKRKMREQRLREHRLPDYAPLKNSENQYHYDPIEQQQSTYTGMGQDINVHDQWACESMGAIQDRTDEHLGKTDIGIIRYRRLLSKMIDQCAAGNTDLLMSGDQSRLQGPRSIDAITSPNNWKQEWVSYDDNRRRSAGWPASIEGAAEPS